MKRSSLPKLGSALLGIITVIIMMGFMNRQNAAAASLQNHEQIVVDAADFSAYRWEAAASHYISHQVWPARDLTSFNTADISAYRWDAMAQYYATYQDLTSFNAADISAYRWNAMAQYYATHQVWPTQDLTSFNAADISAYRWNAMAQYYATHQDLTTFNEGDVSVYRLMMSKPGVWTWEASAH